MKTDRREFLTGAAALTACAGLGAQLASGKNMMWAELVHLGLNLWSDLPRKSCNWDNMTDPVMADAVRRQYTSADHVRFDERLWREVASRHAQAGCNTLVIDLAEAAVYPSHPELAVQGSWNVGKLRAELARLRGMGFDVIPKLNFSTTHDIWLKEYSRMVSTSVYYRVCEDLIRDAIEIFDRPRFVHLGFDEEHAEMQSNAHSLVVVRTGDLWWHDVKLVAGFVEKYGSRPWAWSGYALHPDKPEFLRKMPKSVLLSNWFYHGAENFTEKKPHAWVRAYEELDHAGFDQVPCASNCYARPESLPLTVDYCRRHLGEDRLKGFLMTTWLEMNETFRARHMEAADTIALARKRIG